MDGGANDAEGPASCRSIGDTNKKDLVAAGMKVLASTRMEFPAAAGSCGHGAQPSSGRSGGAGGRGTWPTVGDAAAAGSRRGCSGERVGSRGGSKIRKRNVFSTYRWHWWVISYQLHE
jgi:hypothetical protein